MNKQKNACVLLWNCTLSSLFLGRTDLGNSCDIDKMQLWHSFPSTKPFTYEAVGS
jgi:hypothetical protein